MASALAVALAIAPAAATPGKGTKAPRRTAHVERPRPGGVSVGSPTAGRLPGGVRLEESPALRISPAYANGDVRYALGSLVGALDRAARGVRRAFPGSVLLVGHLSRAGGGELERHASHESGRDVDIGFYVKSLTGKPLLAPHFVPFRGDGTAPTWPGAVFDDARNWLLVSQLVSDPAVRVTHVFVATPLRARLLAYAAKIGVPYTTRVKAAFAMVQPRGALPHDDHFHVRIGCPPAMVSCIEVPAAGDRIARRAPSSGAARSREPAVGRGAARVREMRPAPAAKAGVAVAVEASAHTARREAAAPPTSSGPPASATALPSTPLPSSAAAGSPPPPPAVLAEPIDDVDGVLWGPVDPPEDEP